MTTLKNQKIMAFDINTYGSNNNESKNNNNYKVKNCTSKVIEFAEKYREFINPYMDYIKEEAKDINQKYEEWKVKNNKTYNQAFEDKLSSLAGCYQAYDKFKWYLENRQA